MTSLFLYTVTCGQFNEDVKITTACVGRCDFGYRMDCPRGQRVAPRDLTYYAKQTTAQCPANPVPERNCQSSEACCSHYGGDCSLSFTYQKAFEVFSNCSGYQKCGWFRAESVKTGPSCSYRDMTNYVAASYSCIKGRDCFPQKHPPPSPQKRKLRWDFYQKKVQWQNLCHLMDSLLKFCVALNVKGTQVYVLNRIKSTC